MKKLINIRNKELFDILMVTISNICLLIAKVAIWLVIPRMLHVEEYGYYKIFTLYLGYASLLHLGFPDGILLYYGGKEYTKLDKRELRLNSRFFLFFQLISSLGLITIGLSMCADITQYVVCMIGFDLFFVNIATYYRFISQAVMRFKELVIRNIIQATLQILMIIVVYMISAYTSIQINGRVFIFSVVTIDAIMFVWYIVTYSQMTFGKAMKINEGKKLICYFFTTGIVLTLAYQISHLIFVLDSQMVSVLFDLRSYALYAFSYSIISMVSSTINAVSTVLFPNLKKMTKENAIKRYPVLMNTISVFSCVMLIGYFPIVWFIRFYLPDYGDSLIYLKIILPGLVFSSCINLVLFTYFKVLNRLSSFLHISVAALALGAVTNYIGFLVYRDPISFSVASVITLIVWYILLEILMASIYKLHWKKNFFYILLQVVAFYYITLRIGDGIVAMITYGLSMLLITALFNKKIVVGKISHT